MTLETSYERAGYYLEYLQSLCSEMGKLASVSGLNIHWMIDRLCTFTCQSDFSKYEKDFSMSENWTQLLSVYHNLLCRGVPTYPTFHIEEFLILEAAKLIPIGESSDERTIAFRDQLHGAEKEETVNCAHGVCAIVQYASETPLPIL